MRERAGIAVVTLFLACAVHPGVAGASLPDSAEISGEIGDALDGEADGTVETVEDTTAATEEALDEAADSTTRTVEDTADGTEEAVDEAADSTTRTVEDTTAGTEEAVDEAADSTTRTVEDTADGTTATGAGAGGPGGSSAGVAPGSTSPAREEPPAATGGSTGASATTGSPSAGDAGQQPDGRGSFLELHDSLGWSSPRAAAYPPAGTPGRASRSPAGAAAEPRNTLVATVRVGDDGEPFVANVMFGTPGDTITVHLEPTGGEPLTELDGKGATTERFRGLVAIAGEDPFEADVRAIVRDDGLVLLVERATPVAAVTEVLSRMVERLASTGLPLLALAGLALGLMATGGAAVRSRRSRRWAGAARPART